MVFMVVTLLSLLHLNTLYIQVCLSYIHMLHVFTLFLYPLPHLYECTTTIKGISLYVRQLKLIFNE